MPLNTKKLSVVLAVYNEEANLAACLDSVKLLADEIVVVDGGSTDKTIEIAKQYGALVIQTDNPPIFHINKQKAVDASHGQWILQLDADEIVPVELASEIRQITADHPTINGYYVARKNYFIDQWMKKGGMYPDFVIRLFRRGKGKFPCKSVHEQIEIDGTVDYLKNPMLHKPYPSFSEYMRKADTYTSLTRDELIRSQVKINFFSIIKYLFYLPARTFFSLFVRHQGVLDGWWGFIWAFFSGLHHSWAFIKYISYTAAK